MEEVLDLYAEPYDPQRPKVNFDETSNQLLADIRTPLPLQAGHPRRSEYTYEREGTRTLFGCCEPQTGWRQIGVTAHRTKVDFAHQMKWLVDERYPRAEVIRVVLDNLTTPKPASL
jgi:DDE superfamily endonuclease